MVVIMLFDDDMPTPKKAVFTPADLEKLSIDELEAYIETLKGEIKRVQANIETKSNSKAAAEAFFK